MAARALSAEQDAKLNPWMGILFWSLVVMLWPTEQAYAQTQNCVFVPRSLNQELLSALPENVIGWANCRPAQLDTNIFIVAKLSKSESESISQYLLDYARSVVASGQSSRLVQERQEKSGDQQFLLETARINDLEPMIHYALSVKAKDGANLLFIHTMGQQAHKIAASSLKRAQLLLSGPTFLALLK